MKKQLEPNLELILKSAILALQVTYKEYKAAIINDLQYSWYTDDGEFAFLAGAEERKKKIADLEKEVARLQIEVNEIKDKIQTCRKIGRGVDGSIFFGRDQIKKGDET